MTGSPTLKPTRSRGRWLILTGGRRVGKVAITNGLLNIHVNQPHRGRGLGRAAIRLAVRRSGRSVVRAHLRKSNIASRRALLAAGFRVIKDPSRQLVMEWHRGR